MCVSLFYFNGMLLENPRGEPLGTHPMLILSLAIFLWYIYSFTVAFGNYFLLTSTIPKTPVFIWVLQITVNLIYVSGVRYNSHQAVFIYPCINRLQWLASCQQDPLYNGML